MLCCVVSAPPDQETLDEMLNTGYFATRANCRDYNPEHLEFLNKIHVEVEERFRGEISGPDSTIQNSLESVC